MATTANTKTTITHSGDVRAQYIVNASANDASPASIEIKTLSSGANTITVPTGGSTVVGVVIHPPTGNTVSLTFKGVTGDTGVRLHDTNPSNIGLDSSVSTFVLTAGATLTGVRLYWY